LSTQHLSFIPPLDRAASTLAVTFPPSIDGTSTCATVGFPSSNHQISAGSDRR
jgi:hypothetical protein